MRQVLCIRIEELTGLKGLYAVLSPDTALLHATPVESKNSQINQLPCLQERTRKLSDLRTKESLGNSYDAC